MKYFLTSIIICVLIISILTIKNLSKQENEDFISTDENFTDALVFQAEPSFKYTSPKLSKKTIERIFKHIGKKDHKSPLVAVKSGLILNETNQLGDSILTIAVIKEDEELVEELLKHNVNSSFRNKNGETSLDLAIQSGNSNIINLLLGTGEDNIITDTNNLIKNIY